MLKEFKKNHIKIMDIIYCPHSPNVECECRKPKSGMFLFAKDKYDIDMKNGLKNQNEKTKQHHDQQQARQRGGSVASGWSGAPAAAAWCDGQQRPWLYEP